MLWFRALPLELIIIRQAFLFTILSKEKQSSYLFYINQKRQSSLNTFVF